jgi:hypothetical protein
MGPAFVEALPVGKFHGIGPATSPRTALARCRALWLRGWLPALDRESSQIQSSASAQKCLIETVGEGVRSTPNSGPCRSAAITDAMCQQETQAPQQIASLFDDLGREDAAEDRFDVVTIWIERKCSVVIRPTQTGRSIVGSACLEGGGVESLDLGSRFGCKGGMLLNGVWVISIYPEDRILEAIADAVSSLVIGHLHHSAHTKRPQRRVIEGS